MSSTVLYLLVFIFTLAATVIFENRLIPLLRRIAKQPIYEGGPSWHMTKSGTPTMGGIGFIIPAVFAIGLSAVYFLFIAKNFNTGTSLLCALLFCFGNALIGVFDDVVKLRRKENAGLTPGQKLLLQLLLAILFIMARRFYFNDSTVLSFSFVQIDLGILYYPLAIILLLGIINCANLTDGIDGLASSVSITIGIFYTLIATISASYELSAVSASLVGCALGFWLFNRHPAKIFMGDTGSLFLGSLSASLAFGSKTPFAIVIIGCVYVMEGLSVILQVASYKLTKKRIFIMAPIHHHLEKSGYSENKICLTAVLVTLIGSAIALFLFGWTV